MSLMMNENKPVLSKIKPMVRFSKLVLALLLWPSTINLALAAPTILQVKYKTIQVAGKTFKVMTIAQPDGTWGYLAKTGESFNVIVQNQLNQPTVIHWHGLTLPNSQDGTTLTQALIEPKQQYSYNFKLVNAGTFWMHSHYLWQETLFAEAPLIILAPNDAAYQNVVVMFQDFNFTSPEQLMQQLNAKAMAMNAKADLNDVSYATYLTNYATPQNPQLIQVRPGSKVKLRFINGSSSSNFWLNLGQLSGTAVAADGHDIIPLSGHKFQLAIAQRLDIVVAIPESAGTFPLLGQVEGLKAQTGLVLTTESQLTHYALAANASTIAPALDYQQELQLHSQEKLGDKKVDQVIKYVLTGSMQPYSWQINQQTWPNVTPVKIAQGNRVELEFINQSMMAHPIHLHGFSFKVVAIDDKAVDGAFRDSLLVLPHSSVKVIFDATLPGKWFLHCHTTYHSHSGMMTYVEVVPSS